MRDEDVGAIMMHPLDVTDEVRAKCATSDIRLIESPHLERGGYAKVARTMMGAPSTVLINGKSFEGMRLTRGSSQRSRRSGC